MAKSKVDRPSGLKYLGFGFYFDSRAHQFKAKPHAPFERYADDGVVHCKTKEEALFIKECLEKRFVECKLELHPTKTRIVYCKDKDRTRDEELTEFDFLFHYFNK